MRMTAHPGVAVQGRGSPESPGRVLPAKAAWAAPAPLSGAGQGIRPGQGRETVSAIRKRRITREGRFRRPATGSCATLSPWS